MTDAESIQLLAALNSRALQTIEYNQMGGNNYPPQQRQQFRQPNYPPPNYPQQGLPNHLPPVQDFQVPQIPDYIPTNVPITPVEFPKDANGRPIVPPEYQHLLTPQAQSPVQPQSPANYGNTSFEVPNYNNVSNEETEYKFDIILKEIKSLKKAINKLNKHFLETKLPQQQTDTDKNDTETSTS